MKKYIFSMMGLLVAATMNGQTAYDAETMTNSDLNGTARYVGMGGALGALGADISTMGSNPAGTALMRRSDFSFTAGGVFTGNSGVLNQDAGRASVDQCGILFALNYGGTTVRNFNFGINYQKRRNFLSNLSTDVLLNGGSLSYQISEMANDAWSTYDASRNKQPFGLLPYATIPNGSIKCMEAEGYPVDPSSWPESDGYGTVGFDYVMNDNGVYEGYYYGFPSNAANYRKATYGSNSQVDVNFSANIEDRFFVGASLGIYSMSYDRQVAYYENVNHPDGYNFDYTINNWYHNSADGFDVKMGAIFRPIEDSPFRFGLTIHTPIWYTLHDYNSIYVDVTNYKADVSERRYTFRTPWKFGFSLGHTVDNILALGLEYEFQDYGSCKYYDVSSNNYFNAGANDNIKNNLKGVHTLKVGAEFNASDEFSIRLGYNLVTSPFKSDAYQHLDYYNNEFAEADYTNWGATNRLTFGLGYRFKGGHFDLAYQLQMQKGKLYAYDYDGVDEYAQGALTNMYIAPTEITNNRSQIIATLGFRF